MKKKTVSEPKTSAKAVVIQVNGTGNNDPMDALVIQRNDYALGAWTWVVNDLP